MNEHSHDVIIIKEMVMRSEFLRIPQIKIVELISAYDTE